MADRKAAKKRAGSQRRESARATQGDIRGEIAKIAAAMDLAVVSCNAAAHMLAEGLGGLTLEQRERLSWELGVTAGRMLERADSLTRLASGMAEVPRG